MSSTHSPGWEPPGSDASRPQPSPHPAVQQGDGPRYGDYGTPPVGQPAHPQAGPQGYSGQGGYQDYSSYSSGYSAPGAPLYGAAHGPGPYGVAPYGAGLLGAPRPGIIPLRPLAFGEILGGAFESLRANPRAMFVPALIVMAVVGALSALVSYLLGAQSELYALASSPVETLPEDELNALLSDLWIGTAVQSAVPAILTALATAVLTGLLIVTVSRTILGRVASPGEVWQRTRSRVWALIGQALLTTLITTTAFLIGVAVVMVPVVLLVANDGTGPGAAAAAFISAMVGILVALLIAGALSVKLCLAPAALILEHVGVVEGIRRSWTLTRGHFWRSTGVMIVAFIIVMVVSQVVSTPIGILFPLAAQSPSSLLLLQPIMSFAQSLIQAITLPFMAAVTALLYTDVRMRSEGLDIELRRAAGV